MKSLLYSQKRSSAAAALVTAILGLVLIIRPDRTVDFLCMLLGAAILLTGAIYVLGWLARRKEGIPTFYILPGVVLCALGVWLLTRPREVLFLIQLIVGAILIFHGVLDLQGAITLLRRKWERWWIDMILSVVTIVLGLVVLFDPFKALDTLVVLIGAALVFDGVSDLVLIWRLDRVFKEIDRALEDGQ